MINRAFRVLWVLVAGDDESSSCDCHDSDLQAGLAFAFRQVSLLTPTLHVCKKLPFSLYTMLKRFAKF